MTGTGSIMNLHKKKILIVDMDDFLGIHLVEALLSEGADVRVLDRPKSDKRIGRWREHLPSAGVEIVHHESSSEGLPIGGGYDAVKDADVVYHLWGLYPNEPRKSQAGYALKYARFMEALNLLLACRESGVGRIVQVIKNTVVEEEHLEKPGEGEYLDLTDMNYENIQFDVVELSGNFHDIYGLPIVTVYVQGAFGPFQEKWEIVPAMIDHLKKGKKDIHIKEMNAAGEFTYISDVVQGLLLAASTPNMEGMKFELRTGQKVLHSELANRIAARLGVEVNVVFDNEEKMVGYSSGDGLTRDDTPESQQMPGWTPKVQLDEGLDRIIDWMNHASKG